MRAFGFLQQWNLYRALAGACVLVGVGLTDAAAQFPPPPGQNQSQGQPAAANSPFPPPPQGQQQNQLQSPFPPAPGVQASTPAFGGAAPPSAGGFGAMQQGGFAVRPGGFSGGPAQGSFSAPAPGGFGGPPQAGPTEEQRVCLTFPSIREDVEKGAAGIRAAGDRKATREEVCPLFKAFAVKEAKLVKFLETHQKLCGVPPNVITQVRQNHAKTIQIRNTVCSAAPAAAAAPTLSDALGGPIIADDTSVRAGRGTFDTLTGNALQR